MRLLLRNRQAPGDVLVLTAAVRDLHSAHPDAFRIAVDTAWPAIWENNRHIEPRDELWTPDRVIDAEYPLIHRSNNRPCHFLQGFIYDLEHKLNISIPLGPFCGDIHLSEKEMRLPSPAGEAGHAGPYWVIVAGGKYDFTAKWWDPADYQSVVDHFGGRIHFVQCGVRDDFHPPLSNVTNLVGRTTLRQFIRLIYHADGVLCPVTFAMHLAAAVPTRPGAPPLRPCVVIAGGREPPHWEAYPGHQFLHTIGALDCCAHGGCWKSRCQPIGDGDPADHNLCTRPVSLDDNLQIAKCMAMITPARVIEAINLYYEGGTLHYKPTPAPLTKPKSPPTNQTTTRNLAVTIGVGAYANLARLAAREVELRTGLPTLVLGDSEFAASGLEHPAFLKFRLFDLTDADNILFFDADMVALDNWDPTQFFGHAAIACVRERMISIIREESQSWNIPPEEHFNTGVLILNREHHAPLLRQAESLRFAHPTVLNDQLPINAARLQLNIPLCGLDRRFNFLGFGASSLSHDIPVVFAHRLAPNRQDLNESYFNGDYSLFDPQFKIDQSATARLANSTYNYYDADRNRGIIRLLDDGTIYPTADPDAESYWFVHTKNNRPTIALASETQILHQFVRTMSGTWITIDRPEPEPDPSSDGPRLIETSHAAKEIVITEENARDLADAFIASAPPYVPDRHHGRGIVVCGGGEKYFPCAYICIRMLRHVGCKLPIELWHLDSSEIPEHFKRLVELHNVRTVDASIVQRRHPVRSMTGWVLKPYAILHSDFQEVMLIDADNVAVRDPAYLFDAPEYRAAGAAFWPDFSRLAPDRAIWRICRVGYRDEHEFETGQLLVDKPRTWLPLQLTLHLNQHHTFYYDYVYGDKDLFHMAWRILNRDYAMPPYPLEPLEGTMCQHDFQGRRVFQHRNMLKWKLNSINRCVPGFHFQKECLEFLDDLTDYSKSSIL
jgi:ADP-heptose:LPS heptosyltransferase